MTFVWYPKCSTCKRAKAWLDEHGLEYTARDINEQTPTAAELKAWQGKSGFALRRFFNTSGLLYKGMSLKEKLPKMSEAEQLELLSQYGMLIKRPLLVTEEFVLVGFREAEWSAALL